MAKMYSLVMGIENYPESSGQIKVNYAGNDARAIADYARQAGFHLIDGKPLLDEYATYNNVIEKLDYLFHIANPDDFVLLYFAGHGFYSEYGGYLIPFNYQKDNAINESSCISFDSINKRFKNKKTRHFIFLLDTCHSGYAAKQMDIREADPGARDIHITPEAGEKVKSEMEAMLHKGELSQGIGRLVFTSSAPTEKSHHIDDFQHGLFTYYLLSSLKSKTNKKQVNVEDLVRSVKDSVLEFCLKKKWKQTPTAYSNIQGDFYIPAYETQPREGELVSAPDFSQDIEKARKALQSKDFDSAARIINTILMKDSLNFEANLLLEELDAGRDLQILKEKTEVRQNYEEWLRRGENFLKVGDLSKARECFENAARIYPDSRMAQSYIKEIDTRAQIVKSEDIEVQLGDKAAILKNLFQAANDAFNKGDFTAALNYYNKILKTYPGNQRAIKEKIQLFEKWLQQYKDSARYFEMLGLLENIILPDESLYDDHVRFKGERKETILLYTQAFLKSRINIDYANLIKEKEKKVKLIGSYEKLLIDYHELAMEKEYEELVKIIEKQKTELIDISEKIDLNAKIIGTENILKTQEKKLADHIFTIIESLIKEGVNDRYIIMVYNKIDAERKHLKFNEIKKMPEKDRNQILRKCEALEEFQKGYSGKFKDEVIRELTRYRTVLEIEGIIGMPIKTLEESSKKLKLLTGIDKTKYDITKFDISSEIELTENRLKEQKIANWNRRFKIFDYFSLWSYFLLNLYILVMFLKIPNANELLGEKGIFSMLGQFFISSYCFVFLFRNLKRRNTYAFREKKYRIILSELGKAGMICSSSFICYISIRFYDPKQHFIIIYILSIILILVSFSFYYISSHPTNDEQMKKPNQKAIDES